MHLVFICVFLNIYCEYASKGRQVGDKCSKQMNTDDAQGAHVIIPQNVGVHKGGGGGSTLCRYLMFVINLIDS